MDVSDADSYTNAKVDAHMMRTESRQEKSGTETAA